MDEERAAQGAVQGATRPDGQATLWRRIDAQGARDIAVVGICKHAGKTTALGRLLADAAVEGRRAAALSVGVDGERVDSLLGVAKPRIWAPRGMLFATAVGAQEADGAQIRWLAPSGFGSPQGDVWYGEVLSPGPVILAGVRQLAHLRAARAWLRAAGARHVLIDGAFSRAVGVHPDVCDGVVLAVGAAAGPMPEVARLTRQWMERLTLEPCPALPALERLWAEAQRAVYAAQDDAAEPAVCGPAQDLAALLRDPAVGRSHRLFFFGGALTDDDLLTLALREDPVTAVVRTPLHLFAGPAARNRFLRSGHRLCAQARSVLVALAVNPASPLGPPCDRLALRAALGPLAPDDVPVWDALVDL